MADNELMPRATIAQMVAVWDDCSRDLRTAYALLESVGDRLNNMFSGRRLPLDMGRLEFRDPRCPEDALAYLELEVWSAIVERLELRKILSLAATKQLDAMLDSRSHGQERLGPITVENVSNVLAGMLASIPDQLAIAVTEVYNLLRPHRSKLKTNSKYEVGSKVIIEHVGSYWGVRCSPRADMLRALDRVFHMLDGQGLVPQSYWGELVEALDAARPAGEGATRYFRFRMFRNGNVHLWFLRKDLLHRFNQLAGSGQLKPAVQTGAAA